MTVSYQLPYYTRTIANPAYTAWLQLVNVAGLTPELLSIKPDETITETIYTSGSSTDGGLASAVGNGVYYKASVNEALTQTVSGYTTRAGVTYGVTDISCTMDTLVAPAAIVVGTTNASSRVDLLGATAILEFSYSATLPTGTAIYMAVSWDAGTNYSAFVSAAWLVIAKNDGGTWKYWTGAAYTASAVNNAHHALQQAWGVSGNRMTIAELAALTEGNIAATGGFNPLLAATVDFGIGMKTSSGLVPTLTYLSVGYEGEAGTVSIVGWAGAWTSGSGLGLTWTDNTDVGGQTLGQSGTIMCSGPFPSEYKHLQDIPGFWFLLNVSTDASAALSRVLYTAETQALSNIGTGQPMAPLAFYVHDVTNGTIQKYTEEMADNTYSELSLAPVALDTAGYIYIGNEWRFTEVDLTLWTDNNSVDSVMSGEYWNGAAWVEAFITDGTSLAGKCLRQKGKVTFPLPADWRTSIPLSANMPRGYYLRLSVSVGLTADTAITECRVYPIPDDLKKYSYTATLDDRLALIARSDKPNQVDLSREWEEYGFFGDTTASYEIGAQDSIECAVSAWNSLFLGKRETWVQIAMGDGGYGVQSVEASRHLPVNGEVIVKVPMSGQDGTKYGLAFINRHGAFVSSGLQTDNAFNTSRGFGMGQAVCWWNAEAAIALGLVYLDLDSLHLAQGAYWPVKNWCLWNAKFSDDVWRVMVYDLNLNCWQPLIEGWDLRSICLAYRENGAPVLYGGTSHGTVLRLFDGDTDTDYVSGAEVDTAISASLTTTLLGSGDATWELRRMKAIGASDSNITVAIYVDGSDTVHAAGTLALPGLTNPVGKDFAKDLHTREVRGNFFQLAFTVTGPAELHGALVELGLVRQELL